MPSSLPLRPGTRTHPRVPKVPYFSYLVSARAYNPPPNQLSCPSIFLTENAIPSSKSRHARRRDPPQDPLQDLTALITSAWSPILYSTEPRLHVEVKGFFLQRDGRSERFAIVDEEGIRNARLIIKEAKVKEGVYVGFTITTHDGHRTPWDIWPPASFTPLGDLILTNSKSKFHPPPNPTHPQAGRTTISFSDIHSTNPMKTKTHNGRPTAATATTSFKVTYERKPAETEIVNSPAKFRWVLVFNTAVPAAAVNPIQEIIEARRPVRKKTPPPPLPHMGRGVIKSGDGRSGKKGVQAGIVKATSIKGGRWHAARKGCGCGACKAAGF